MMNNKKHSIRERIIKEIIKVDKREKYYKMKLSYIHLYKNIIGNDCKKLVIERERIEQEIQYKNKPYVAIIMSVIVPYFILFTGLCLENIINENKEGRVVFIVIIIVSLMSLGKIVVETCIENATIKEYSICLNALKEIEEEIRKI